MPTGSQAFALTDCGFISLVIQPFRCFAYPTLGYSPDCDGYPPPASLTLLAHEMNSHSSAGLFVRP